MKLELTPEQRAAARRGPRLRGSARSRRTPASWDREEAIPRELVDKLVERGWLGSMVPAEHGGGGLDMSPTACSPRRSAAAARRCARCSPCTTWSARRILRWGSQAQQERWLPRAGRGRDRSAPSPSPSPTPAATPRAIETTAVPRTARLRARRPQEVDHLRPDRRPLPGLRQAATASRRRSWWSGRRPGSRSSRSRGIARHPRLDARRAAASTAAASRAEHLVGRPGFGVSHVVGAALDQGRYSVACGSVGIAQACLDACLALRPRAPAVRRAAVRAPARPGHARPT